MSNLKIFSRQDKRTIRRQWAIDKNTPHNISKLYDTIMTTKNLFTLVKSL